MQSEGLDIATAEGIRLRTWPFALGYEHGFNNPKSQKIICHFYDFNLPNFIIFFVFNNFILHLPAFFLLEANFSMRYDSALYSLN
ncbi:MAG: hypothetical protein H0V82_11470 [Candidatus Protochlamydia sp.]|nr:hypothetical protein [Candidatus Protochlamydia sp.]